MEEEIPSENIIKLFILIDISDSLCNYKTTYISVF